jgi:hypothetical protein
MKTHISLKTEDLVSPVNILNKILFFPSKYDVSETYSIMYLFHKMMTHDSATKGKTTIMGLDFGSFFVYVIAHKGTCFFTSQLLIIVSEN